MIIEGLSFSEAAEKYSEDGSAANKGDLGWLNPGDTIPEFEKEMDNLDLNEISQPVKTALGWHLIMVTDRGEKDLSTESLRQRVRESLLKQKTDIKFNDWVKHLGKVLTSKFGSMKTNEENYLISSSHPAILEGLD